MEENFMVSISGSLQEDGSESSQGQVHDDT